MVHRDITPRTKPWRCFWLAFVMLCVVLKPAIGFAGELHRDLHEAAHATQQATASIASPSIAGDLEEHAPASGWHAVMHVDLCCGNAALPSTIDMPSFVAEASSVATMPARVIPPATDVDHFRPPIAG